MDYFVITIKQRQYKVWVKNIDNIPSYEDSGSDLALEAARFEYEKSLIRYQNLVNKAYIMLTACAFLFSGVLEVLKKAECLNISLLFWQQLFKVSSLVFFLLAIALFSRVLLNLKLSHFDPHQVLERDMFYVDKRKVAKYLCIKYVQNTNDNNIAINDRHKIFKYGMYAFGADVVLVSIGLLLVYMIKAV